MAMTIKGLRQTLLNRDTNILEPQELWLNDHICDLKDEALHEMVKNYSSTITKFKKAGVPFKLKFKTRRHLFKLFQC